MIIVKIKTVQKTTEVFLTDKYLICERKNLHPDILSVDIYDTGKKICHLKRHFQWFYKKYLYKPLPKNENENENKNKEIADGSSKN